MFKKNGELEKRYIEVLEKILLHEKNKEIYFNVENMKGFNEYDMFYRLLYGFGFKFEVYYNSNHLKSVVIKSKTRRKIFNRKVFNDIYEKRTKEKNEIKIIKYR